jgi:hypothetical protein
MSKPFVTFWSQGLQCNFALILVLENQIGCPTNFKPNGYLSELHLNQLVLYQNN